MLKYKTFLVATLALTLVGLTGCPVAATPSRTSNQGGGNLVTAGAKIAGGSIASLTPDELQVITDKAVEVNPNIDIPELSDEEAAAAVDFLVANDLNTLDDVVNLIQEAETDPNAIVVPDSVMSVLEGLISN